MTDRATLLVLARAADVGLIETAELAASVVDPFLRGGVRRRVRAAVDAAEERVKAAPRPTHPHRALGKREAGGPEHVLRLAFVLQHPERPASLDVADADAVDDAFDRLAAPLLARRRAFWPITTSLVLLVLAASLSVTAVLLVPLMTPTADERFRGTAFGMALADPLTDFVSAVGHGRSPDAAKAQLTSSDVTRQIGPAAAAALSRALDAAPAAHTSQESETGRALAPLYAAINDTNAALDAAQVPALLHAYANGEAGSRGVWVTAHFVRRRGNVTIDGASLPTAWTLRLDRLNLTDSLVIKLDGETWAVLSLDQVEVELVANYLAPMASGAALGGRSEAAKGPGANAARYAGRAVADELLAAASLTSSDAATVREALATRNASARSLDAKGYAVTSSSALRLSPALVQGLERAEQRHGPDAPLLQDMLRMDRRMGVYRKQMALAVDQIALLEEQQFAGRVLDQKRLTGVEVAALSDEGIASDYARGMLSSTLALLARPQPSPRLALVHAAALDKDAVVSRRQIAAIALHALFVELGASSAGQAARLTSLDDDQFAAAFQTALEAPPERVRAAAARAYRTLFGRDVPTYTRTER